MHCPEPQAALVEEYWRAYRLRCGRPERDGSDGWAFEEVNDAAIKGDEGVVDVLVALAEAVLDDDKALAFLGAGPIEDLLRHHAGTFIDQIDAAARQIPSFRTALRCAWFDQFLPSDQAQRLRRFGPPL